MKEKAADNTIILKQKEADGLALVLKYRSAVMGFAALWIFFFHAWIFVFEECPVIADVECFIRRTGFGGVDIFLFLSGIGLTFSIRKGSVWEFYYRRLRRVIPPFLTMAVVECIVDRWTVSTFLKNIFGYNLLFRNIFAFLWFVPVITVLYFIFPWYYRLFAKSSKPILFLVGSVEIWLFASLLLMGILRKDLYVFTNRIPVFLIGICFGWIMQNRKVIFTGATWCVVIVSLFLGQYLSYLALYKKIFILIPIHGSFIPNILNAVSISILLPKLLDCLCKTRGFRTAGNIMVRILSFFGSFSLELYCVQEWLASKMIGAMRTYPDMVINLVVFLSVTAIAFGAHCIFQWFWQMFDRMMAK